MSANVIKKVSAFNNNADDLWPFITESSTFFEQQLAGNPKLSKITSKVKMILTELLTNSIKHGAVVNSVFNFFAGVDSIVIEKWDHGQPFYLKAFENREALTWPLEQSVSGSLKIYSDDFAGLYAEITDPCSLRFYTEDYVITQAGASFNINEHFGLMIISKLSESFTYRYNPETGTNLFSVNFVL
jgi:hypothetical protein